MSKFIEMKSIITVLVVLGTITTSINAQPVITSSNIPNIGDIYNYQFSKLTGVTIGTTGINQTWDYSTLIDTTSTAVDSILSMASAPNPQAFPEANIISHFLTDNEGVVDSVYVYLKKTPDSLKTIAFTSPFITFTYRTPIANFPYPFTYGNFFNDSSLVIVDFTGGRDSLMYIDSTYAIGYGTLKLPGNRIYDNVLQLKRIITQRGTSFLSKNIDIIYTKSGVPAPLLETDFNTSGNPTLVRYLKNYTTTPSSAIYTFIGNGYWSMPSNWSGNTAPPSVITAGTEIRINPVVNGACILNIPITMPSGSKLIVQQNANFIIQGNLTIQ